jgi:hypothetical protein
VRRSSASASRARPPSAAHHRAVRRITAPCTATAATSAAMSRCGSDRPSGSGAGRPQDRRRPRGRRPCQAKCASRTPGGTAPIRA